jgi:hypothetical protein
MIVAAQDFAMQKAYMKDLDRCFENPNNIVEELEVWAMGVMQAYPYNPRGDAHTKLINTLSYMLVSNLEKARNISALQLIEFFLQVYGSGGPFDHKEFHVKLNNKTSPQLLGALYFISSAEFTGVDESTRNRAPKVVVDLAFEGQKKWKALSAVLQEIDKAKPGYNLMAGIPDMLMNLEKHMVCESDAVFMQGAGGIERIKAVGADLNKVSASVLQSIDETDMNQAGLPVVFEFVTEATEDLKASGKITLAQAGERYAQMLAGVVCSLRKPKNLKYDCWKPMLNALAPYVGQETGNELVLHLARVNGTANTGLSNEAMRSIIEPETFKKSLGKLIDAGDQYDLVIGLGIEDLFTEKEINKIKGQKLESALGM